MARYNERHRVSATSMRTHASILRALADTHDNLAKGMDAAGLAAVDTLSMKTGVLGLVNLSKFLSAVTNAYCDNAAAKGIAEIAGAAEELRRLTNRTKDEAFKDLPAHQGDGDDDETIAREVAEKSESLTKSKRRKPKK